MSKSGEVFSVVTAEALTSCGNRGKRLRYAVLHLHLRFVEVRAQPERDRQRSSRRRPWPAKTL